LDAGGGVWSTAVLDGALATLLAGAETTAALDEDELPVSAGAASAALESVAGADGAELPPPVPSVEPADGVELPVSPAEFGSAGAESAGAEEAGAVDVADPVGSEAGVVGATVVAPAAPSGDEPPVDGLPALGSVVAGADGDVPAPPFEGPFGGVNPPVAPEPGLTVVGVEVAPPEVVEVLDAGACGAPAAVELTVPGDSALAFGGWMNGPAARGACRPGTEASSLSRVVGGATAR
jgi:hypothetical protein